MFFRKKQVEKPSLNFKATAANIAEYLDKFENIDFRGAANKRPLEVTIEKRVRFIRLSLQLESSFHLDTIEIINEEDKVISKGKKTLISSVYEDNELYSGYGVLESRKNAGCGFHTKRERNPWLVIDLTQPTNIKRLVVYNRDDIYFTRAMSLLVQTSNDLINWHVEHDNLAAVKQYIKDGMSKEEIALAYAGVFDEDKAREIIDGYTESGEYEKALSFHESVNQIIASRGIALGPHGFTRTFALNSSEKNQTNYNDLSQLLTWINEEFDVPAFICCGTLLGVFRDGKFIGHDDDIDICYISKKKTPPEILEERKKLVSFLRSKGCTMNSSVAAHYWCTMPSGVNVDIFTGFIEDGHCSMNPLRRRGVKVEDIVPIQKQTVQNAILYLPRDPEQVLIFNYGPNWRIPDPLWKFDWTGVKEQYDFLFF